MIDGNELDDGLTEDDVEYDTNVPDEPSFVIPRHNLQGSANIKWAEAHDKIARDTLRDNRILRSQLKAYGQLQTVLNNAITQDGADQTVEIDTPPPQSSPPVLESRLGNLAITWDGTDYRGGPMPSDFMHLDVYAVETSRIPSGADFNFKFNPLEVVEPVSEDSDGDAPDSDVEVVDEEETPAVEPDDTEYPEQDNSVPIQWPPLSIGSIAVSGANGVIIVPGLKYNTEYTVWFLSVDRAGNIGEASERRALSVKPIVDTDLIGRIIDQANIELGAIDRELLNPEVKAEIDKALSDAEAAVEGIEDAVNDAAEAKTEAVRAANDAASALEKALESLTTANNVDAKATQAQTDAAAAQAAADQARADAQEAADKALEAAGLVAGKGQIIYQETEPTGDLRNTSNLWIKTSTGKPHTFDGTNWVPIVDQDVVDAMLLALTEANNASAAATAAQARADAAHTLAGSASSAAAQAQATASSKNQTFRSTSAASGTASNGDTWEQWDSLGSGGKLKAFWRHNGSSWVKGTLDETYLPLVNIGQGTYGELNGNRLVADSVSTRALLVGSFDNLIQDPTFDYPLDEAWTVQVVGSGSGATVEKVTDPVQGASLKLNPTYGFRSVLRQVNAVSGKAGDQVYVSFWYKIEGATAGNKFITRIWSGNANGGYLAYSYPPNYWLSDRSGTWQQFTGIATIANNSNITRIRFEVESTAANDAGTITISNPTMRMAATGALIVDGAIGANHVQANSISADKVLMDQAFASQMYANRILVGPEDFAPGPGGYENAWSLIRATLRTISTDRSGVCFDFGNGSGDGQVRGPMMPVKAGTSYYLEANTGWFNSSTTGGNVVLRMEWFDSPTGSRISYSDAVTFPDGTTNDTRSGVVTAPANATYGRFYIYAFSRSGAGIRVVRNVICRPQTGGELIVDGAITTRTLAADAVTADKIVANAITTPKIASNSIIGDHIVGNSITGNKIQGNTITGDKIQGNTISGDKIMANAITSAKINAGAIDGMLITGASIRTSLIGRRVEMDTSGLRLKDSSNNDVVFLSTLDGTAFFAGDVQSGLDSNAVRLTNSAVYDRPGIRLSSTLGGNRDAGIFSPGVVTNGYPAGSLVASASEATLNSSGRGELQLSRGGDVSLIANWGPNNGVGMVTSGRRIDFRGQLSDSYSSQTTITPWYGIVPSNGAGGTVTLTLTPVPNGIRNGQVTANTSDPRVVSLGLQPGASVLTVTMYRSNSVNTGVQGLFYWRET